MFEAPSGKDNDSVSVSQLTTPVIHDFRGSDDQFQMVVHRVPTSVAYNGTPATRVPAPSLVGVVTSSASRLGCAIGGQQNAQRNLGPAASDSNASTKVVAFVLVAPSGKTYSRAGSSACLGGLSTSFEVRRGIPSTLSTHFPRSASAGPAVTLPAPTPGHHGGRARHDRLAPGPVRSLPRRSGGEA